LPAGYLILGYVLGGNPAQGTAGFLSLQVPFGGQRSIAVYFEIDVVFDCQSDRVLHGQIKLAAANQSIEPA
jgi:hypothetical protein